MTEPFDSDYPPNNYKSFKKSVMASLESLEMESDDMYTPALFLVDRKGKGHIVYALEIAQAKGISPQSVIMYGFPNYIKKNSGKFYAIVFPGVHTTETSSREILTLLSGNMERTDIAISEVERDTELDTAELEPWEKQDIMKFSDFVMSFRRAICPQG